MPGPWEMAIIAVVALLLFGRRLPEVGRSLGKGIVEFKKGLKEVQDEVNKPAEEPAKTSTPSNVADEVAKLRAEVERLKTDEPAAVPPVNVADEIAKLRAEVERLKAEKGASSASHN
jgi:sec-independent protein translocase protein TatA